MDLIGDIVEHEIKAPEPPKAININGFPSRTAIKESRWKQRMRSNKDLHSTPRQPAQKNEPPMSESAKIHQENMEKINQMTEGEIQAERDELLNSLDPKLIKSLLKRVEKRQKNEKNGGHVHAEGQENDGWIGGDKNGKMSLPALDPKDVDDALGIKHLTMEEDTNSCKKDTETEPKKSVKFNEVATVKYEDVSEDVLLDSDGWEDVEDVNELVPGMRPQNEEDFAADGYQLTESIGREAGVHFSQPKKEDLDLNDPDFFDKLHEKYYPDLPKETQKLSWMTTPMPTEMPSSYDSISDLRFDFKGNLIILEKEVPTHLGLHHHSDNPQMAGYTLSELAHLARSIMPSQRCISIQTLGRILYKLKSKKYLIAPIRANGSESEQDEVEENYMDNFGKMMWDLIEQLRIIETITDAANEKITRNLSVRNYATEALWLWKKGEEEGQGEIKDSTE